MFRCSNCLCEFELPLSTLQEHGEKLFLCPLCKGNGFYETASIMDKSRFVRKNEVIESSVMALSAINSNQPELAGEILIELVCSLVGKSVFEYRTALESARLDTKDRLIAELCTLLEVKGV